MGVPSFFRWLHDNMPRCLHNYREVPTDPDADEWPPNPNGVEFDNLYLDFNQIVHNATHPQGRPAPRDLPAMVAAVCDVIDRLVLAVRPRRMLVLAFDGVAPRAKMNQQRARRYLSVRERGAEASAQAVVAATWGVEAPAEHFDHNAITPGTEFMHHLSVELRAYIGARMAESGAWAKLSVVLSDASAPGEGEHKIVAMVREQRAQPGYDPDTTHLLYGLDADLVMLGLATHEAHFYLLRDYVPIGRERFAKNCDACGAPGHLASECNVLRAAQAAQTEEQRLAAAMAKPADTPLMLLDVSALREYLLHSLRPEALLPPRPAHTPSAVRVSAGDGDCEGGDSSWWDSERLVDDFVFLTFLVGNDFLPALPTLSIATGGLDSALAVYRATRRTMGGYLLTDGSLQLVRGRHVCKGMDTRARTCGAYVRPWACAMCHEFDSCCASMCDACCAACTRPTPEHDDAYQQCI